jgi:hypothetical protein
MPYVNNSDLKIIEEMRTAKSLAVIFKQQVLNESDPKRRLILISIWTELTSLVEYDEEKSRQVQFFKFGPLP